MLRWVILAALAVLILGLSVGCGTTGQAPLGGAPTADTSATPNNAQPGGSLAFTVNFPDRSDASTRLIPVRTQSVEFYLVDERNNVIYWDYATPDDPYVTIDGMPAGLSGYVVAIAYPWAYDDTGAASRELELPPLHDALAYASQAVTIPPAGETESISLVLESTIVSLECEPSTLILDVGEEIYPFVTAWNEWGDLVFIDPRTLEWDIVEQYPDDTTTTDVVGVLSYGGIGGRGYGSADLTVTETESGVVAWVYAEVVEGGSGELVTSIAGRVADATDPSIAIAGAELTITPVGDATAAEYTGTVYSDGDGYFHFDAVAPGPSILTVVSPVGSPYALWENEIEVPGNASLWLDMLLLPQRTDDAIVDIVIEPLDAVVGPGGWLQYRARAYDAGGREVRVAPMWFARGRVGRIESDGWFRARSVAGVGEIIAIMGSHSARTSVTVASEGGTDGPLGAVFGQTVDALDTSLLIGGVTITAYPWSDAASARRAGERPSKPVGVREFASTVSGPDGEFALEGIPAGPTTLWVDPLPEANVEPFGIDLDVIGNSDVDVQITLPTTDIMNQLSWVEVWPNDWDGPVVVAPGDVVPFGVTAWDYTDEAIPVTPTFTVIGPVGRIDETGLFGARPDLGGEPYLEGPVGIQVGWYSVWVEVRVEDTGSP